MMLHEASSRVYILRVCKYYSYSMEDLTILFNSLIMSVLVYAIGAWACAFCRRARFRCTTNVISINDLIDQRDVPSIAKKNRMENYVTENMILYCRKFELNAPSDVLSKMSF